MIVKTLKNAVKEEKVSHAYLLVVLVEQEKQVLQNIC